MYKRLLRTVTTVLLVLSCAVAQKTVDLGDLQQCSSTQTEQWKIIQQELGGIETRDPYSPEVGSYSAGRFGFAGLYLFPYNWLPMSTRKQTMCGRLERFDWNPLGKEQDWNLRIIPSQLFVNMFKDAKQYASDLDDVWTCDPKPQADNERHLCGTTSGVSFDSKLHNCIEAEVTPRSDRFETLWFRRGNTSENKNACSTVVDYDMCVYGPYVTEAVHGNRPEIHPLEAIWWRNAQKSALSSPKAEDWTLVHIQDASDRYDERLDFVPHPDKNVIDWSPWAESPRVADFRIGVEVSDQPSTPLRFYSDEFYSDGVVLNEPGETNTQYTATYKGREIFQLVEKQSGSDHYQVRLDGFCRMPTSAIRMFITIRSTIGLPKQRGHKAELGFHAIRVWNAINAGQSVFSLSASPTEAAVAIGRDSLHASKVSGHFQLFGELEPMRKEYGASDVGANKHSTVTLESLLPPDDKIDFFQRVLSIHQSYQSNENAGQLLAAYLGVAPVPEESVQKVSDTVFTAAPQFVISREGEPAWEDSDEVFGSLNSELAEAGQSGQTQLLNINPKSTWSFQAWTCGEHPDKGCIKRTELKVLTGRPTSDQTNSVYVDVDEEGDVPRIHVYFPDKGNYRDTLILLLATGSVIDPDTGKSTSTTVRFYNIAFTVKDHSDAETERVVDTLAKLIEVPKEKLSGSAPPNIAVPFAQSARYRQAEMLRLNIKHAAEGGAIEPEAMNLFVLAAGRLAALP
jgi:hypothetical protein